MDTATTRRGLLKAAPIAAAAIAIPATVVAADDPDAAILAAWDTRQRALAILESRGTFFDCEDHSPTEAEAFSDANDFIAGASAQTPQGLLAQLWVALEASGGTIRHEWQRQRCDALRRADLSEIEQMRRKLEWDQYTVFAAIKSLAVQIAVA